jgi:versiconal hemiacetal acetate reductase
MTHPNPDPGIQSSLGQSGLKVSQIILGAMSYGSSKWQDWVLDEEQAL